jgi:uncharacterized membrane protein YfcA
MTESFTSVQILAVLFVATFVRSTLGFGEALIAVPLLALFIPIKVAAPVAVSISITVAAIALIKDWRHVHVRSASWLVVSTLIGTPLGLLLLISGQGGVVKVCLSLFLAGFSAYGYWLAGLWTTEVTRCYLISLPGVILATFLGRALNGRIDAGSFLRCVNLGLLVVGHPARAELAWGPLAGIDGEMRRAIVDLYGPTIG